LERPRRLHGKCTRRVETEEEDAGPIADAYVGAYVQLGELRHPRQRRNSARHHVGHVERHHAHPRLAIEEIELERSRDFRAQVCRVHAPMRKEQVVPGLRHQPWPRRDGPRPMSYFVEDAIVEVALDHS
jgi:hypothetical protein